MDEEGLPEFAGLYLEDSYFLGLVAEGRNLRLKCLFAVTADHPDYGPPKRGEQHCYREGSIVLEEPSLVEWHPQKPAITRDPDGTFDFGAIELYRRGPSRFHFITQWFDATMDAKQLSLQISESNV